MRIVIVMPAYNAAKTIESVFDRIPKDFWRKVYRVVVVNDGSKDNLPEVLRRIKKKYRKITVLTHDLNRGYGAAQKTGFTEAVRLGADIAVLLHSDGQYAPEILQKMIAPIENGEADVVLGSRMLGGEALKGGMPLYKYIGNRALTFIENIAYGMNITEYHTGYMVYSKRALATIPFTRLSNTFHFDGEMIMMSGKKKLRIREVPIPTRYAEEKSHLKPIKYGIDVLKIIWRNLTGKYDF
ncbi:MAG: glycosyltransferase family 2 protein [Candidatus Woesearchaeota archaeon]